MGLPLLLVSKLPLRFLSSVVGGVVEGILEVPVVVADPLVKVAPLVSPLLEVGTGSSSSSVMTSQARLFMSKFLDMSWSSRVEFVRLVRELCVGVARLAGDVLAAVLVVVPDLLGGKVPDVVLGVVPGASPVDLVVVAGVVLVVEFCPPSMLSPDPSSTFCTLSAFIVAGQVSLISVGVTVGDADPTAPPT